MSAASAVAQRRALAPSSTAGRSVAPTRARQRHRRRRPNRTHRRTVTSTWTGAGGTGCPRHWRARRRPGARRHRVRSADGTTLARRVAGALSDERIVSGAGCLPGFRGSRADRVRRKAACRHPPPSGRRPGDRRHGPRRCPARLEGHLQRTLGAARPCCWTYARRGVSWPLAGTFLLLVVVTDFAASYERRNWIPYRIVCSV